MPDSLQIISIAAISFVIGVLVCLLCGLYLLPALVRAQSTELIRDYSTYVQPSSPMRVIILDRNNGPAKLLDRPAAPPLAISKAIRVDSPAANAGSHLRTRSLAQAPARHQEVFRHEEIFHQIYEHNLQLRQPIARQAVSAIQ